jgi:hypothetical protein
VCDVYVEVLLSSDQTMKPFQVFHRVVVLALRCPKVLESL